MLVEDELDEELSRAVDGLHTKSSPVISPIAAE
jgi:hypothetical protein